MAKLWTRASDMAGAPLLEVPSSSCCEHPAPTWDRTWNGIRREVEHVPRRANHMSDRTGGEHMDLKREGMWDQAKGRVKEAWGTLTDDDLDRTEGKRDRLVGTIKQKTGETADTIEQKLDQILDKIR